MRAWTAGSRPSEAFVTYSSYDDRTAPLAGGPQYRLQRGATVLVFAGSFDSDGVYLLHGSKAELLGRVEALRRGAGQFSASQLEFNEITEDDRRAQVELYDSVIAFLRSRE